ncbi:MAG: hypothetical protein LBL64_05875, partial [Treponema sp.]|nr:hypothetical protein [Treponema sp.]
MFEQTVLSEAEKPMNLLFLERPRVDRILEKALQSYMVTVVAGEGSGKTHAVNSFLRKHKRNVTWIQISEQDNLGWHLWENYLGEVARVGPETAKLFSDIGFPESDQQLDQYLGLLKDKTMGLADPYVTVFDDFHLITNPEVLLHLDRALAALVSNNHFVFISRTEPTIRTVNFLSKGILSEITVDDLRFTREETESYFRLNNIFIEEKALSRIFEKTEGWPLALGLILQEIKAGEAGGHNWNRVMRPIRNMEEDIFASMGAKLRCFLVKLSLMEHWPRNLLERLDPEGKNIAAMEKLSSVIRFDAYIQGFRIHSHFLDFLREQQSSLSPEEIREVCGQDARWCVENNLPTNAAIDYEWAGDYGGLIRLIESLPRTLSRTVASFFLGIVERLTGETAEDGEDRDFLFLRFIVRSRLLASLDRFEEAAAECRAVIDRFEPLAPEPGRSLILAAAYNNLGTLSIRFCRYTRSYDFAEWFEKGYRHYLENPEPARGQIGQSNIGSYAIQVGIAATPEELKVFVDACAAAAAYTSVSLSGYLCGTDALTRSELAYYQGDMNRAEQFARRAAYQGREKNQYEVETCALFYLMRLNIARGNIAGIREAEQQLKLQMEKGEYINRYNIQDTIMGRFYIRLG